jgi:hypothetical protein
MSSVGKRISSDICCYLDVDTPPTLTSHAMLLAVQGAMFPHRTDSRNDQTLLMMYSHHSVKEVL